MTLVILWKEETIWPGTKFNLALDTLKFSKLDNGFRPRIHHKLKLKANRWIQTCSKAEHF